jgi:hypothetical protein
MQANRAISRVAFICIFAVTNAAIAQAPAQSQPPTTSPAPHPLQFVDMKNVSNAGDADAQKAALVLDRMVAALGGERWMTITDIEQEGRSASFYKGTPNGGYTLFWSFHRVPDHDRVEATKQRNVVQIINRNDAWEITFQGKHRLEKDVSEDFIRRRDHSIEAVLRTWLKKPGNVLFYGGQRMAERHLADEVTVLTGENDSVTLLVDSNSHLPRTRTFYWRDPVYKDKNQDDETYDNWHLADGLPSAFIVTRYRNADMTRQVYLSKVSYNQGLPDAMFDADLEAAKLLK